MDHQNIRFHNVEELEPVEGGWLLRRVGAAARARISPGVQENCFATGIEPVSYTHLGPTKEITAEYRKFEKKDAMPAKVTEE